MEKEKIVPVPGKRNVLITSALPYVNNVPHLGNIIGCVLSADVYARYCRARGYQTLYISGTDNYGTASEMKALAEGVSPEVICSKFHDLHRAVYKWFNISFDYFGRTSTESQTKIAQDIYLRVRQHNATLEREQPQLYCDECQRFLSDRFVEGECPDCHYPDARGDQCDRCQKLLTPAELKKPRCAVLRAVGEGRKPEPCGAQPRERVSEHVYLDLPQLAPRLQRWIDHTRSTGGKWTANTDRVTDAWLRDGLLPRAITRDLRWGTPVPEEKYKDKVFYVWFDAPIGYISITAEFLPDDWQRWWKTGANNPESGQFAVALATADSPTAAAAADPVELVQFMGKDNIPFHTVIFPSTLLAAADNYTLVRTVSTTEYLNYEEAKFSKSLGIGVFGDQARETGVPTAVWRYYLLAVRPETSDSTFSWDDFQARCNSELLANFGNYVNRVLKFTQANFGGAVPSYTDAVASALRDRHAQLVAAASGGVGGAAQKDDDNNGDGDDDPVAPFVDLLTAASNATSDYITAMEQQQLRDGLQQAMTVSKLGNGFLQRTKPWDLLDRAKKVADDPAQVAVLRAQCADALALGLQLAYHCAALLEPFVPSLSAAVESQLGFPPRAAAAADDVDLSSPQLFCSPLPIQPVLDPFAVPVDQVLGQVEPLVRKLTASEIDQFRQRFSGHQAAGADGLPLFPLDLRVGRVDSLAPHPHPDVAERQWVLQVTVGPAEQRQLVSGVRGSYPDPDALVGRQVIIVCNLKPSKFKGVASNGMVLAAQSSEHPDQFGLCGLPSDAPARARQPGARVLPVGTSFDMKKAPAKFDIKKKWAALGLVTGPGNAAAVSSALVAEAAATKGKKGDKKQPSSSSSSGSAPVVNTNTDEVQFAALQISLGPDESVKVVVDSPCSPGDIIK